VLDGPRRCHWARALEPLRDPKGLPAWSHLGLFALKAEPKRSIRLASLAAREIAPIVSLAGKLGEGASLLASARDGETGSRPC